MKNLHIIPTDKPSRLWTNNLRRRLELDEFPEQHPNQIAKHIYITSDEEIKEGDYFLYDKTEIRYKTNGTEYHGRDLCHISGNRRYKINKSKKIILTDNKDLINDGIQPVNDEFLEWFVKNPSCEEVEVADYGNVLFDDKVFHMYKIIIPSSEIWKDIPKEEPKQETNLKKHLDSCEEYQGPRRSAIVDKQETIEEAAEKYAEIYRCPATNDNEYCKHDIISAINFGAKWQQERMYSEEDMRLSFETGRNFQLTGEDNFNELIEQFKKKISK